MVALPALVPLKKKVKIVRERWYNEQQLTSLWYFSDLQSIASWTILVLCSWLISWFLSLSCLSLTGCHTQATLEVYLVWARHSFWRSMASLMSTGAGVGKMTTSLTGAWKAGASQAKTFFFGIVGFNSYTAHLFHLVSVGVCRLAGASVSLWEFVCLFLFLLCPFPGTWSN